ncbi:MAG: ATP-binding protein [Gammaproteobacteria bacterium]|nr:ATP-binding protein [Gammaproteobacteria bacterium]
MLEPITDPHRLTLADLLGIDRQKTLLTRNTLQFVRGAPCNNALLWGARGTGKSSLVKALLNEFADDGLRLIEIDAHALIDLPHVVAPLRGRPERFILYVDDLSFDADDSSYRTLKAALDGSVSSAPDNVVIYATSNRRHLLPEHHSDNLDAKIVDGEIHHGEAVEEKISLSERFGIWLAFHPFSQRLYLEVVSHWLAQQGVPELTEEAERAALQWALLRGNRSGRVAAQFARDWAGQRAIVDEL